MDKATTPGLEFVSAEVSEAAYRPILEKITRYAEKSGRDVGNLRVADIGCGKGRLTIYLRSQGIQAFGVDPNPEYLAKSQKLATEFGFPEDIFIGKTSEELEAASFDVVIHIMVLEHVVQYGWSTDKFLHHAVRIMKPEGLYLAEIPNLLYPVEGHAELWLFHWIPGVRLKYIWGRMFRKEDALNWAQNITHHVQYHTALTMYLKHRRLLAKCRLATWERVMDERHDWRRSLTAARIYGLVRRTRALRWPAWIIATTFASISVEGEGKWEVV